MKASELFPGAVVLYKGQYHVLEGFYNGRAVLEKVSGSVPADELLSAPITPEALERLGFEKSGRRYIHGNLTIKIDGVAFTLHHPMEMPTYFSFIHQLQAIALHVYGEELQWK